MAVKFAYLIYFHYLCIENKKDMNKLKNRHKQARRTMHGTIVNAGRVKNILTSHGKSNQSAMLHIQEDESDPSSAQVAVKVTGDLCNYVGCIGAHVVVEYVVRVFEFVKNGVKTLGNDVYATSIRFAR